MERENPTTVLELGCGTTPCNIERLNRLLPEDLRINTETLIVAVDLEEAFVKKLEREGKGNLLKMPQSPQEWEELVKTAQSNEDQLPIVLHADAVKELDRFPDGLFTHILIIFPDDSLLAALAGYDFSELGINSIDFYNQLSRVLTHQGKVIIILDQPQYIKRREIDLTDNKGNIKSHLIELPFTSVLNTLQNNRFRVEEQKLDPKQLQGLSHFAEILRRDKFTEFYLLIAEPDEAYST